jgi:hypothetical protein
MGLDQYIIAISREEVNSYYTDLSQNIPSVDFLSSENSYDGDVIIYWRKHYEINDWFYQLYCKKGGVEDFNSNTVILEKVDMERLLQDIKSDKIIPRLEKEQQEDQVQLKDEYIQNIEYVLEYMEDEKVIYYVANL